MKQYMSVSKLTSEEQNQMLCKEVMLKVGSNFWDGNR